MNLTIPSTMMDLLFNFSVVFTNPTFENFVILTLGAILTNGPRTVTNILRAVKPLAKKHFTSYHNFLKRAKWHSLELSRILCMLLFSWIKGVIELSVDETLSRHSGRNVWAASAQRDAVRSTKKRVNYSFGHKWVVLAVRFHLPGIKRAWSLPVFAMLWLSQKVSQANNQRHRTPCEWTRLMLRFLHKWFPNQKFILSGDGAYASILLTQFCGQRDWITLVSRLRMDARLYEKPRKKRKGQKGRPAIKGKRLPSPQQVANSRKTKWQETIVPWYGGTQKRILFSLQRALIYKSGEGVVEILWILVRDPEGKLRDEAFFTTDLSMAPEELIRHFVERWGIEVTFQEARRFLQIESTRNRKKESVQRSFPLLLGLFSFIALWYAHYLKDHPQTLTQEDWYQKEEPTFADAIQTMREQFWRESIFSISGKNQNMIKIPGQLTGFLTAFLARAA